MSIPPQHGITFDSSPSIRKPGDAATAAVPLLPRGCCGGMPCDVVHHTGDLGHLSWFYRENVRLKPWVFHGFFHTKYGSQGSCTCSLSILESSHLQTYNSSKIHQCHGCFRQHCWKQNMIWVDVEEFLQTTPSIWVCLKVPLKFHG